jgi:hypothetical protein
VKPSEPGFHIYFNLFKMEDGQYGMCYSPVSSFQSPLALKGYFLRLPPRNVLLIRNLTAVDGSIWFYAPNKGAPVFFTVAFAASGGYHVYQCM